MSIGQVIVVDDDKAVLDSWVSLLSVEGCAVRGFSSAQAFLDEAEKLQVACLVTDLQMPQTDGLALIRQMHERGLTQVPTIVISGQATVPATVLAMQMGAKTVMEKPVPPQTLVDAVRAALEEFQAPRETAEAAAFRLRYETLSPREREALSHLVNGASSKATAFALGVSPRTIDVFRANILRKMKAPNIASLATQAALLGRS